MLELAYTHRSHQTYLSIIIPPITISALDRRPRSSSIIMTMSDVVVGFGEEANDPRTSSRSPSPTTHSSPSSSRADRLTPTLDPSPAYSPLGINPPECLD